MASPNLELYDSTDTTEITAINYGTGDAGEILPTADGTEYHLWNDKGGTLGSDDAIAIRFSVRDADGDEVDPITVQKWVEVKSTVVLEDDGETTPSGYTDDDMTDFEPVGQDAYVLIGDIPTNCYRVVFIRVSIPPSAEQAAVTFSIYITPQYLSAGIADYITDIHGDGVLPTGDMCEVTDNAGADSVIDIASGVALINDNAVLVYAQSKTLPTDADTYKVYLTLDGVISYTADAIPTNSIELAEVVIAANVVDSVTDSREFILNVRSTIADTDKFLKSSGTGASFAELTEADISDLGTYLEDITAENLADLSDIPAHPGVATKILETTVDGYAWIDTPAGGGVTELSDLSDVNTSTATNRYVLVADGTDFESRLLVEADISDLGTYLEDITSESIGDLSDVDLTSIANEKMLQYNSTSGNWECVDAPSGGSGYTNLTSFVSQTAWRIFYSNTDGDVTELAFGADGTYLKSNGEAAAPSWGAPAGGGDMLEAIYDTDSDGQIDVAAGGTEKASWTQYCIPYLSGATAFGEIAIGTAGQLLKVSVGATGYEWFTPDYISGITGESIGDLSDVDLTGIANEKILQYNSTSSNWECVDVPSSGETNTASNIGSQVEIFKQKSTYDLEFRTLKAGSDKIIISNLAEKDIDIGSAAEDYDTTAPSGWTLIDLNNPSNKAGQITTIEIFANTELSGCKVATFFAVDATHYSTRDYELIGTVPAGSKQVFSVNIDVEIGDVVGIYFSAGLIESYSAATLDMKAKSGDNIPCTNASFLVYGYTQSMALFGYGSTETLDYINFDVDAEAVLADLTLTEADISDLGTYLEVNLTSPAKGDILYYDGDNWVNLGIGTSGQVLTVSAGGIPEWATP